MTGTLGAALRTILLSSVTSAPALPQWRESKIGKLRTGATFDLEPPDVAGWHSAAVNGLDDGKGHSFRLWLRGRQMELYIDDLLMQSFFSLTPSGRTGFISQEAEAKLSYLTSCGMNL